MEKKSEKKRGDYKIDFSPRSASSGSLLGNFGRKKIEEETNLYPHADPSQHQLGFLLASSPPLPRRAKHQRSEERPISSFFFLSYLPSNKTKRALFTLKKQ